MYDEGCVLGVDGGGSQTRCAISNLSGEILGKSIADPSSVRK